MVSISKTTITGKRILIIGRYDSPTAFLVNYVRDNSKISTCIKINPQLLASQPLIELLEFNERRKTRQCYFGSHEYIEIYTSSFIGKLLLLLTNLFIFLFILIIYIRSKPFDVVIGIGPLNGYIASLYSFRKGSAKIVYYAEDKIVNFHTDFMSKITHFCDANASKRSHAIWVLSELLVSESPKIYKEKYSFVPMPIFKRIKPWSAKTARKLVFLGSITPEHGFDLLYSIFKHLYKRFPYIRLIIIGTGQRASEFTREYVHDGLEGVIENKGYISENKQLSRILLTADIGICLYNPLLYCNLAYGQSSKISDYLSNGLPVVMTGSKTNMPSLASYVRKFNAGFVLRYNEKEVYTAIYKLLSDGPLYRKMRNNTRLFSQVFDAQKNYTRAFNKIFITES